VLRRQVHSVKSIGRTQCACLGLYSSGDPFSDASVLEFDLRRVTTARQSMGGNSKCRTFCFVHSLVGPPSDSFWQRSGVTHAVESELSRCSPTHMTDGHHLAQGRHGLYSICTLSSSAKASCPAKASGVVLGSQFKKRNEDDTFVSGVVVIGSDALHLDVLDRY
jgi:hypothetical protein